MHNSKYSFGPSAFGDNFIISAFAPEKSVVGLSIDSDVIPMERRDHGFWEVKIGKERSGSKYGFMLDGRGPFPDPGGRYMPDGINGFSSLVDIGGYSRKETGWKGLELDEYIIYELHVGAFTEAGTYGGAEQKLEHLSELGVTAVEIMPVAQFYGSRNWGYDGVYIYAPHYAYGNPQDLMHLVDAIHSQGMCAILDVVYNHSGPVDNYLEEFAPFHSQWHITPWGNCFNLDGEYSDQIREYILQNAIYWLREFRFDALRLDAVHGIVDHSPVHVLEEMSQRVDHLSRESGRRINLIAESDRNDRKLTRERGECGMGMDAQWNDDFHHSIHTRLTGETDGYYMDYGGENDILRVMSGGFLYNGQFSQYLKRKRGTAWDNPKQKLVVCSQNHDQVGNRAMGERLLTLAGPEKARLAAFLTILSPFTPLLFMGEEMGEDSPFLFFIQTDDEKVAKSVYSGRLEEFSRFRWSNGTPDPCDLDTFKKSMIKWENAQSKRSIDFLYLYEKLIESRKQFVLKNRESVSCSMKAGGVLQMQYGDELMILASLNGEESEIPIQEEKWKVIIDTSLEEFGGQNRSPSMSSGVFRLAPFAAAALVNQAAVFP